MASHTEFQQPSFSVGVEEGVCEVVPIVLRDLKGFVLDAVVQVLHGDEEEDVYSSTSLKYFHLMLLCTSTPRHFRGQYCTFHST